MRREFVEYLEESIFPSYELDKIVTEVSNLFWFISGLENTSVKVMSDVSIVMTNDSTVQIGNPYGKIVSSGPYVHMEQ